jgi:hypothetical protein
MMFMTVVPDASMRASVALALLAVALLAGCGSHGPHFRVGEAEARRQAHSVRVGWLREVRAHTAAGWTSVPPRPALLARLRSSAGSNRFTVESAAGISRPVVIIESDDYMRMARTLPQLVKGVHERDYPAFFLEVVDSRHVPYIVVFDSLRGHVMGGQWARADDLYPFPHG